MWTGGVSHARSRSESRSLCRFRQVILTAVDDCYAARRMVNAIAGPRARDLSQGPIGGILGELGYGKGEVVKL